MNYSRDLEFQILSALNGSGEEGAEPVEVTLDWQEAPGWFSIPSAPGGELEVSWDLLFDNLTELRRRRLIVGTLYLTRIEGVRLDVGGYALLRDLREDNFVKEHAELVLDMEEGLQEREALRQDLKESRAERDVLLLEKGQLQERVTGLQRDNATITQKANDSANAAQAARAQGRWLMLGLGIAAVVAAVAVMMLLK